MGVPGDEWTIDNKGIDHKSRHRSACNESKKAKAEA
jgi:hypothetical protein